MSSDERCYAAGCDARATHIFTYSGPHVRLADAAGNTFPLPETATVTARAPFCDEHGDPARRPPA